jgi:hypothetical protein
MMVKEITLRGAGESVTATLPKEMADRLESGFSLFAWHPSLGYDHRAVDL